MTEIEIKNKTFNIYVANGIGELPTESVIGEEMMIEDGMIKIVQWIDHEKTLMAAFPSDKFYAIIE
jgi:hypothetical protein